MAKVSHVISAFVLLAGLAACSSPSTPATGGTPPPSGAAPSAAPKTDPVIQQLAGTWEIDCGNGFVQFKLVVAQDSTGRFEWQTYTEPGGTKTTINRMDLRLAPAGGVAEATVTRADVALFNGKKMRIAPKDADSIVVSPGGAESVVDMDYTLYRESAGRVVDCGGD